jgi:Uma2 family endonuclease
LEAGGLGEAFQEAGYKLSHDPATWVHPDVSFLLKSRVLETYAEDYFPGAPNLAIEIVSPPETAPQLQRKIKLMLEKGCQAVWAVYSKSGKVQVHLPDGTSYTRGMGDKLDAEFLLPGWQFPVSALFED